MHAQKEEQTIETFFKRTCPALFLTIQLIVMITAPFPMSAIAKSPLLYGVMSEEEMVESVDWQIASLLGKRDMVQLKLQNMHWFARTTGAWIIELYEVNQRIQGVSKQLQSAVAGTHEAGKLDEKLRRLYTYRTQIIFEYSRESSEPKYDSHEALLAALVDKIQESLTLTGEYSKLSQQLTERNKGRDRLFEKIPDNMYKKAELRLTGLKTRLRQRNREVSLYIELTEDPSIEFWGEYGDGKIPYFMPGAMLWQAVVNAYKAEIAKTSGAEYDHAEAFKRFREFSSNSEEIKEYVASTLIPETAAEVNLLKVKIEKLK